jgi:transcriptional regulator with XRE-family HTH domain
MRPLPETTVPDLPDLATRRAIREAAGLSRRAMAELLGCHENSIVNWELGLRQGVGGQYVIPYLNLLATLDRQNRQREAAG